MRCTQATIPVLLTLLTLPILAAAAGAAATGGNVGVVVRIEQSGAVYVQLRYNVTPGLTEVPAPVQPIPATITAKVNGETVPVVYSNGSIIVASEVEGLAVVEYYANVTQYPDGSLGFNVEYNGTVTLEVEPGIVLLNMPSAVYNVSIVNNTLVLLVGAPFSVRYVVTVPPTTATTTTATQTKTPTTTPKTSTTTTPAKTATTTPRAKTPTTTTTTVPAKTATATHTTTTPKTTKTATTPATTTTTPATSTTTLATPTTTAAAPLATATTPQTRTGKTVAPQTQAATSPAVKPTTTPAPSPPQPATTATSTPKGRGLSGWQAALAAILVALAVLALVAAKRGGHSSPPPAGGGGGSGGGGSPGSSSGSSGGGVEPLIIASLDSTDKLILRKLREAGGSMYQSELQRATGLPKTTVWRHVRRLAELGYVRVVREGKYNRVILVKDVEENAGG